MADCNCETYIKNTEVPGGVIVLKCTNCGTEYTLFPNGEITFERPQSLILAGSNG